MRLPPTAISLLLCVLCSCRQPTLSKVSADIESYFSTNRIRNHLRFIAEVPHRSPNNERVARYIANTLSGYGYSVVVEESETLLHQPIESSLQLISPIKKNLDLREKAIANDPYSAIADRELPYLAYSPDGRLTAELVYANYGDRQDYELLKKSGVSVEGKIALVRAQGVCRAMKNVIAEEEGIAALLIYPEPRDLGFVKASFPDGPSINAWAVQRGTLLQSFRTPGDPRKAQENTLPRIPAIPISTSVATELLNQIKGIAAPAEWKGWLHSDYVIGSGPGVVQMRIRGEFSAAKIRNVVATFGAERSMPIVMAGTHYDAWVYGASDPSSGVAVLMEVAHVLSQLIKNGWKPQRPLALAFWDAEEYGMHGSASWAKTHEDTPAVYWNVDTAVRGGKDFVAHASPGLRTPLRNVLQYIEDPESQRRLSDLYSEFDLPGFTSDTASLTGFKGVPAAEISFGRAFPLYHTLYDDLFWFEKYADPDFTYSATLARLMALNLYYWMDEPVLPYEFSEIGTFGLHHIAELQHNFPATRLQGFNQQIVEYQRAARRFQSAKKSHLRAPRMDIDLLLHKAIACFFVKQNADFATANLLIGPDHGSGCGCAGLPALRRALDSKLSIDNEIGKLQNAYASATSLLQEATSLLMRSDHSK